MGVGDKVEDGGMGLVVMGVVGWWLLWMREELCMERRGALHACLLIRVGWLWRYFDLDNLKVAIMLPIT
jgi:hypothetical protein